MLWRFKACSLCLLATSLMVSCGPRETRVSEGIREQVLHLGNGVEPLDLDPHITTGVPESNLHFAFFEGLVSPDPRTLDPIEGVAERWDISEDGLTYTFHLRQDARWSNGDPLKSQDFIYSWRRILNPALAAPNAFLLEPVYNARAYNQGEITDFEQVGFEAPDDYTIIIRLAFPTPYFLSMLLHPAWYPVHGPTIEAFDGFDKRSADWTRAGNHVGNGPFRLAEWKTNQVIIAEKNPHYWDADTVRLNAIHFYPIDDLHAEERAFLSQQLHITESLPTIKVDSYRDSPYLRIDPYLGTYYYTYNLRRPPLDNLQTRQALSAAIDRESIVQLLNSGQQVATRLIPPSLQRGLLETLPAAVDEDRAFEQPVNPSLNQMYILYNTSDDHRLVAEAVQQMWREAQGVTIQLQNQEWKALLDTRKRYEFDILRGGWIADYPAPDSFLEIWKSDAENNFSGWGNATFDALMDFRVDYQGLSREERLFRAETILLEEAPLIPIYFYVSRYLIHPAVRNWFPTALDWHPYKYVYLEDPGEN